MFQNNLQTCHKLLHSIQHTLHIHIRSSHNKIGTRNFSILRKSYELEPKPIPVTTSTHSPTTGDEKHIEVHAFRSLITIAPEPDSIDPNELSLSFTERRVATFQKQNQLKLSESEANMSALGKHSPAIAYEIWHSPPEVYDKVYGFESDCEPPDRHNISWRWLYKLWGYYSEREIRYRCALYTYMKAQRRCMNEQFWSVFELENTFRVELQLLCLHIWFAKIRMINGWGLHKGHKLCYKTFKIFFEQLPNRFGQHLSGSKSRWEQDCQQACLHFAVSLDHAKEDYESEDGGDKEAFAKVIWNELYLSNKDIEHDLLWLWTDYICHQLHHLEHNVSDNEFINGWWKFDEIPTVNDRLQIRRKIIDDFENEQ